MWVVVLLLAAMMSGYIARPYDRRTARTSRGIAGGVRGGWAAARDVRQSRGTSRSARTSTGSGSKRSQNGGGGSRGRSSRPRQESYLKGLWGEWVLAGKHTKKWAKETGASVKTGWLMTRAFGQSARENYRSAAEAAEQNFNDRRQRFADNQARRRAAFEGRPTDEAVVSVVSVERPVQDTVDQNGSSHQASQNGSSHVEGDLVTTTAPEVGNVDIGEFASPADMKAAMEQLDGLAESLLQAQNAFTEGVQKLISSYEGAEFTTDNLNAAVATLQEASMADKDIVNIAGFQEHSQPVHTALDEAIALGEHSEQIGAQGKTESFRGR